jgi:hypothetical protein
LEIVVRHSRRLLIKRSEAACGPPRGSRIAWVDSQDLLDLGNKFYLVVVLGFVSDHISH